MLLKGHEKGDPSLFGSKVGRLIESGYRQEDMHDFNEVEGVEDTGKVFVLLPGVAPPVRYFYTGLKEMIRTLGDVVEVDYSNVSFVPELLFAQLHDKVNELHGKEIHVVASSIGARALYEFWVGNLEMQHLIKRAFLIGPAASFRDVFGIDSVRSRPLLARGLRDMGMMGPIKKVFNYDPAYFVSPHDREKVLASIDDEALTQRVLWFSQPFHFRGKFSTPADIIWWEDDRIWERSQISQEQLFYSDLSDVHVIPGHHGHITTCRDDIYSIILRGIETEKLRDW